MQTSLFEIQIHTAENSAASEQILEDNKPRLTNQCRIVLAALMRGEALTTSKALAVYEIGDLRARIRDLVKFNGVIVSKKLIDGRYKEYSISAEECERLKNIL